MQKVASFLSTYWPVIAALAPTVIVGLSKAPKDGNFLDWVKWALQLFSVVTHKDQDGTFKLPLTAKMAKPSASPPLSVLVPFILSAVAVGGCGSWFQANKGRLITAAECAGLAMLPQVKQLVAQIEAGNMAAILSASSDLLQCALPLLSSGPPSALVTASTVMVNRAQGAAAARAELARRGIKVPQ